MPAKIIDEFTYLPISKDAKFRLRKKKSGLCRMCDKPTKVGNLCLKHSLKFREYQRDREGHVRRNNSISYRVAKRNSGIE